jgi:hypothetical protein
VPNFVALIIGCMIFEFTNSIPVGIAASLPTLYDDQNGQSMISILQDQSEHAPIYMIYLI